MRVEFPGTTYHLMTRGDGRENVFLDDLDPQDFDKTTVGPHQKAEFQVHAYSIMRHN